MSKAKICISIDEILLAKIDAVRVLEKRGSVSNSIEFLIDISKYNFLEITDQTSGIKFIANPIHVNPFAWSGNCEHDWAASADPNYPNIKSVCLKCNAKIYEQE